MRELHDYGGLVTGSRLKRLSDSMFAGVDAVYRAHGVTLSSRCFPLLFLLRDNGPTRVTALAAQLGQSHPAVSQMSRTLAAHGAIVEQADPADERRRVLALSDEGTVLLARLDTVWRAITGSVEDLGTEVGLDLAAALSRLESALRTRPFAERIEARLQLAQRDAVEIVPFEPRYREDFKRLNVEWLEKYFYVEAIDNAVLSQPEEHILKPGGFIFLARYRDEIVGTCALIKAGRGRMELSKMAVTEKYQGLRIGHRLLTTAIAQFRKTGLRTLFLESSSKLARALSLYEANGFRHAPKPAGAAHYQRADVYMVYTPPARRRR